MTFSIENAIVYDIETYPNCFTFHFEMLNSDYEGTFEISQFRDDRAALITFFNYLNQSQTAMIGFNNIHFDYPVCHFIFCNPHATVQQIYDKAMSIINRPDTDDNNGFGRYAHVIWDRDRFAPQIDVYKINHFDNKAKATNLKALQINMRSEMVVESSVPFGQPLTYEQIERELIPYNKHDVKQTKKFAHFNADAIKFRIDQIDQFGIDVLNWPDTKIGSSMMESRLGKEICYDYSTGQKKKRQTPRTRIAINEIIFPYIQFQQPEFNRVLNYFRNQVLTAQQIEDALKENEEVPEDFDATDIKTKGVFKGLKATIDGFDFCFGVGGIHGSISSQRVISTDDWLLRDIDVAALYPSIGIVNGLYPEHLGHRFVQVYSQLPAERKDWQKKKGKKCVEANALKLASNGVYGNSNSKFSVFYDPKYTMTITINGQLMLCMLAERLMTVPTLKIIQINTDGITYFIHKNYEPQAAAVCREWERATALVLEDADYNRMFIRDVNSYVAEGKDGSLKMKGAYWTPDPLDYAASISNAQPPAWHKDLGNVVSVRAAVAAMVHGVDPEAFIRASTNPYDFMCRIKVNRADQLLYNGMPIQKNTRYYVSTTGAELIKVAPPPAGKVLGMYKKKNKVSDAEYIRVMTETGGAWDGRVNTGKLGKPDTQGVYVERRTNVQSGFLTTICNNVQDFRFETINYAYYVNEAKKLIV